MIKSILLNKKLALLLNSRMILAAPGKKMKGAIFQSTSRQMFGIIKAGTLWGQRGMFPVETESWEKLGNSARHLSPRENTTVPPTQVIAYSERCQRLHRSELHFVPLSFRVTEVGLAQGFPGKAKGPICCPFKSQDLEMPWKNRWRGKKKEKKHNPGRKTGHFNSGGPTWPRQPGGLRGIF